MNLPVFPLPIFLLPDGVTRLRIFEPRYLKMVSIACQQNGFVLCVFDHNAELNVPAWGAWVDIINFSQEGELLNIDIKAKSLVSIENVTMDDDQLRFADCTEIPHWPQQDLLPHHTLLAEKLMHVYEEYPDQAALYPEPKFDDINWVCARFLEILPLSFEKKQLFTKENSFANAEDFLNVIILGQ
jgi:Lon protease-like protein